MGWPDEFRVWKDVYPLNCLDKIIVPHGIDSGLWLPDVAIVTADSFYELPKSDLYPVRITSGGMVDFSPGGFIRFNCKMNLNLFPFDSMDCLGRIESWFYTTDKQVFNKNDSSITIYNFTQHEQWRLDDFEMAFEDVFYPTTGNTYGAINFMLYLSRKSGYYVLNILIPSSLMSTLQLITFILPPNQTIRIEVSFICLLAYTMFQSVIQADLPKSSDQTPLLSIYITLMIVYIAIAISMQCVVMTMTNKASVGSEVPQWLLMFVNHKITRELELAQTLPDDRNKDSDIPHIEDKHEVIEPKVLKSKRRHANAKIWKYLFIRVDTVSAIIYLLLIVFTSIILLAIVPAASV